MGTEGLVIRGIFNDREARVPLVVRGQNSKEQGVAAILDTGFSVPGAPMQTT